MTTPPAGRRKDFFGFDVPFMAHIGVVPVRLVVDHARVSLPFAADLANTSGAIHGGMLMSALDFAMSAVARSHDAEHYTVATIDMTSSFLAPALTEVEIEARCLRRGSSIAFCEAEARDTAGELVARSTGSFKLLRRHRAPDATERD